MRFAALLFFSTLVFAQQPLSEAVPRPEVRPEDKCTVEGRVLNGKTGGPLNKAQVALYGQGPEAPPAGAITDASGRFVVQNVDPGTYRISVSRNGFARSEPNRSLPGQPSSVVTLSAGQRLKDLTFRLQPAAVISGRVLDEDGEPLANAQVQGLRYRYIRGKRQLAPAGNASTDDLGNYRLFGLVPGKYYVKASYWDRGPAMMMMSGGARSANASPESPMEVHAPLYYPGVLDPAQADAVAVSDGEERRAVDFRMTRTRTVWVKGRVTGPVAFSAQRVPVVMMLPRGSRFVTDRPAYSRVKADGTFELRGVLPGQYSLTVMLENDGSRLTARRDLDVADANVDGLELALSPGAELAGSVRVENAADTAPKLDSARVLLQAGDDFMPYGFGNAAVGPDGTFVAKDLADGNYRVRVFGLPERQYVRAIRAGDADVSETGIHVAQGSAPGPLLITVSADAGSLDGRVVDSDKKARSGARVVLVGKMLQDGSASTSSDQNGNFRIPTVPPGDYSLYAFEEAEPGAWEDPEFLEPYQSKATKVSVQPNGRQSAEVEMIPVRNR